MRDEVTTVDDAFMYTLGNVLLISELRDIRM